MSDQGRPASDGNLKVPFGLKDGRLYRPDDVPSGLPCGCICPACETKLVANHGKQKRSYFSHHRTESCAGGYETAVHLMAKQVILDEMRLRIPPITIPFEFSPIEDEKPIRSSVHYPERDVELVDVVAEKQQGRWRPDLTATLKNQAPLYIEILVTHAVEEEKADTLDNLVEVDLSNIPLESVYDAKAFSEEVVLNAPRRWYRCSLYDDLKRTKDARRELEERAARMASEHQAQKAEQEKRAYHTQMAQMREENRRKASQRLKSKDSFKNDALIRQKLRGQLSKVRDRKAAYVAPPAGGLDNIPVDGEWVFSVPRSTWQHYILEECLPNMRVDQSFTAKDILAKVVHQFPWSPNISEVMRLRHKLSDADAQDIPEPVQIIAAYLKVLAVHAVISFGGGQDSFTRFKGDRWSKYGIWSG